MLVSIIKREFQDNLFSFKFSLTLIVCLVLFLTSAYLMTEDYQKRVQQYSTTKSQAERPIAERQPIPLSVLAKGLDNSMGYAQQHNPLFAIFGTLDFMYIVKVALSLMAIFFSFGVISGEKENGTLALTMSNAVSRNTVILGKWIGNYAALIAPFLLAAIIELLVISLSGWVSVDGETWVRMILMIAVSLVYISVFFGLGVFVSAMTQKPSTSLIISILIWATLLLAVPSTVVLGSRSIVDVPSLEETQQKKDAAWRELYTETARKLGDKLTNQVEETQMAWDDMYRRMSENNKRLDDLRKQKLRRRTSMARNMTRISPALSYVFASTALAGTGIDDKYSYDDLAEKTRAEADGNQEARRARDKIAPPDVSTLSRKTLQESLRIALPDIAVLLILNVLIFMCAYIAFMRYDVRPR